MIFRVVAAHTLVTIALTASIAGAQQPAAPAIPALTCVKPELPGAFADSRRLDRFNKEGKTYGDCIKKYVDETKAISDAAIEAGNKAIKDYNAFAAEVEEKAAKK
jgi:hypothetical protein